MKLKALAIAAGLALSGVLQAQEYKLAKSTGTLEIKEVNHVTIEGAPGNEIVFSSSDNSRGDDIRAKGLRAISSMGYEDNTGLGLSVVENGPVYQVNQLKKTDGPKVRIQVPKGVKVIYSHTSPHGDELKIQNFEGEVEVSTVHSGIELSNVSGPLNVKTVHGDIDASFNAAPKNPISITSVHAHVDVALPVSAKANLKLSTTWGEIFVDPEFKIEIDRGAGGLVKYDGVTGKLNGGGVDIKLTSSHDNVYLRKK